MLTCKQASELISEHQERPLTRRERWGLTLHLAICISCRRFKRQLGLLRQALRQLAHSDRENLPGPELPPQARQRIRRSLNEHDPHSSE
ncbi:MAG: zf-HC2 domain-containing protein [Pseudomonadota bacterium]|nr:zf-HC2 domain-containing protein [Pseudomonadota bacterium]